MTTKKLIFILCVFGISVGLFTCIDPIDFVEPEAIQNAISIQGKLTKGDTSQIEVRISEVFNFSEVSKLIDARYVELIDEDGHNLALESRRQGIYTLAILPTMDLKVAYGKGYQIKTELNNGQVYESAFDTLFPTVTPLDLTVHKNQRLITNPIGIIDTFDFVEFRVSTTFPSFNGEKINLLWEMESTFKLIDSPGIYLSCPRDCRPTNPERIAKTCFVDIDPIQNYRTLNVSSLSGDEVMGFTLLSQEANSFIFSEGYYLTVFQQSLSPEAFEYWSTVELLTNPVGTIFELPAGRIPTNIRNVNNPKEAVFGYFFATEARTNRIFVSPEFAGFPKPICPAFPNPDGSGPGNCCDCLCEPNSSIEQPVWWVE